MRTLGGEDSLVVLDLSELDKRKSLCDTTGTWDTVDMGRPDTGEVDVGRWDTGEVDVCKWNTGEVDVGRWDTGEVDVGRRGTVDVDR